MSRINSNTPVATGQRSNRNMSSRSFGSTDFGRLDVLYWTPVVPKDEWSLSCQGILKGATMPAPTIAKMYYDVRFHFVPLRILTHRPEEGRNNFVWDYFINSLTSTSHPYINLSTLSAPMTAGSTFFDAYRLADYRRLLSQLRLPEALYNTIAYFDASSSFGSTKVYPWPFMAYQRIWWDRYRDKSLIDDSLLATYIPFPSPGGNNFSAGSGPVAKWIQPRYVCWPKDYFTNARSGLGTQGNGVLFVKNTFIGQGDRDNSVNPKNIPLDDPQQYADNTNLSIYGAEGSGAAGNELTIAAIRMAKLVDNYLQRLNIAGTSLINRIFARFGVRPKEELLNMSQYLGGFRHEFGVGGIISNIETGSVPAQAVDNAFNYGADGSQVGQNTGSIYCEFGTKGNINFRSDSEYGILMVTGSLVPYTGYYQGLHKSWTHGLGGSSTTEARTEYLTPEFANAGLQPVLKQELFGNSSSSSADWNSLFGFNERYGEYAYQPDSVDGDLVLTATKTGMNSLHLFREFSAVPSLTATFTMIDPAARESLDRIFNYLKTGDSSETLLDHFQRVIYFEANVNRSLASSMLPDLFEDNNHGNVVSVSVGGDRF